MRGVALQNMRNMSGAELSSTWCAPRARFASLWESWPRPVGAIPFFHFMWHVRGWAKGLDVTCCDLFERLQLRLDELAASTAAGLVSRVLCYHGGNFVGKHLPWCVPLFVSCVHVLNHAAQHRLSRKTYAAPSCDDASRDSCTCRCST